MSNTASGTPNHAAYYRAVTAEDERLTAVLGSIRADQESGVLSVRQAADNRVAALETHIQNCQQLRRKYLPTD